MDRSDKGFTVSCNQEIPRHGSGYSNKYDKRDNGNATNSNDSHDNNWGSRDVVRWYSKFQSTLVKYFKKIAIPFGVVSASFMTTGISKAYAETVVEKSPIGFVEKFIHNGDITNSPYADKGVNFNIGDYAPEQIQSFLDFLLPEALKRIWGDSSLKGIVEIAIDCLSYVYNFLTHVIIATPSVIFDSAWFAESYLKFAGISIVVFTLMAIWNAGRKTFNLSHTKFSDVVRRYFLAITGIGFMSFFLQQFFKVVKFISEIILSIGYSQINAKDFASFSSVGTGDTVALVLFVAVLIGLTVKITLENGRRWFSLAFIGLTSSFALSAWVLDSTRTMFNEVKSKFIKLSITQIYHVAMISVMGIFLVGTAGVETFMDLIIKLSMILGGFSIMSSPPAIFDRLVDRNTETVLNMYEKAKSMINYKLNPAYALGQQLNKGLGISQKGKRVFGAVKNDFKLK